MRVDIHSHLMWYPDHISERTAAEALAAKRVKLARSGGRSYAAHLDLHVQDATPKEHLAAAAQADRVVVFGLHARPTGFLVPNDVIAEYAAAHPDRIEGWASVNPAEPGAVAEFERCVHDLGLRGLKVGPAYQHWDPRDSSTWEVFALCERLNLPVMVHQGATFPSTARLDLAAPMLLEPLAMAFPRLRIVIAHLGHPWEQDVVVLIRKAPNVYSDVSACHYRPYQFWRAMITAYEYGVTDKLLLGSDFPSATVNDVIAGLRAVNDVVAGTALPRLPDEDIEAIIERNAERFLYGSAGT
ncbi:amidohydrolase family protein [Dactylosporangium sp. CA-233914]|uniref:amidohydrolase family protein n=1 Tax=Dactylosporangium sp. CA-233914 TaxID=3239934 RepID=UPI003D8B0779